MVTQKLARIPNLKDLSLHARDHSDNIINYNASLIKLFSKLKIERLVNLEIQLGCPLDAYEILKVVIERLGKNLQKLQLKCDNAK